MNPKTFETNKVSISEDITGECRSGTKGSCLFYKCFHSILNTLLICSNLYFKNARKGTFTFVIIEYITFPHFSP